MSLTLLLRIWLLLLRVVLLDRIPPDFPTLASRDRGADCGGSQAGGGAGRLDRANGTRACGVAPSPNRRDGSGVLGVGNGGDGGELFGAVAGL